MLQIIKLDWFTIKYCQKRIFIILPCVFLAGYISSIYVVPTSAILFFLFSLNLYAVEEKGDLNRLYLTLPVTRNTIVTGRYCLSLFMVFGGIAAGIILMPITNLVSFSKWYPDLKWMITIVAFSLFVCALFYFFMYPILFKLGYQKGKFWGFYLPAVLLGSIYIAFLEYASLPGKETLITDLLIYASEHLILICGGILFLTFALLVASYLLSLYFYIRREF